MGWRINVKNVGGINYSVFGCPKNVSLISPFKYQATRALRPSVAVVTRSCNNQPLSLRVREVQVFYASHLLFSLPMV